MSKLKSLQSTEPIDSYNIEFEYNGNKYSAPIEGNLVMKHISSSDIKKHLNELPGKLAYWGDFKIQIEMEYEKLEADFDEWYQAAYMEVDAEEPKKTEGWKKSKVALDNSKEYRLRKGQISELKSILMKVGVLLSGYNNQVWTLREIARITTAEMSNIEISGRGSLSGR